MTRSRVGRPRAAVLVPTHDHAATLDLAVRSALEQTVEDIEVVVIGDGVGADTRDVVAALAMEDSRIRFLDLPKGPNHGEIHRDRAVRETTAEIVCYLCDDDLLLPGHVEAMAELLHDADLVQSQNGRLEVGGSWRHQFSNLATPACREWILHPDRNLVSLTGTAHTVAAYERLPHGWRTTPPGHWPDHYMWQQFLTEPWVRAATATRVTALHFPGHLEGREDWTPEARRSEIEAWWTSISTPEGRARFEESVRRAVTVQSTDEFLVREGLEDSLAAEEAARLRLEADVANLTRDLKAVAATRMWRLRSWLIDLLPMRAIARAKTRRSQLGRSAADADEEA